MTAVNAPIGVDDIMQNIMKELQLQLVLYQQQEH
jgi:hypothetical protein